MPDQKKSICIAFSTKFTKDGLLIMGKPYNPLAEDAKEKAKASQRWMQEKQAELEAAGIKRGIVAEGDLTDVRGELLNKFYGLHDLWSGDSDV